MTTATSIITDALRESNIIPLGATPTTNQITEALRLLNNLLLSTVGNEAGDGLDEINVGGQYDMSSLCSVYVPDDARLLLNHSSPLTFSLDPEPYEGQRLSVVDTFGRLGTYGVTLNGNGRTIEGASSLTLSTNGDNRQWMYRSDIGGWVKINTLLATDTMPFPQEFDGYFITLLAMRLNPRYGQQTTAETMAFLKRYRNQLRARYHAWRQIMSDLDTRGFFNDQRGSTNLNSSEFNIGRVYPWR